MTLAGTLPARQSRAVDMPAAPLSADTRERILAESLGLFADKGYAGVSVRDIVESVGLTPGAIYHHFSGKQAIYALVVEQAFTAVGDRLVEEAPQEGPAEERLREALRRFARYLFTRAPEIRMVDRVIMETGERQLDFAQLVNGPRIALAAIVARIDRTAPADDIAEHAIAAIYGAAKLRPVRATFPESDRFADPDALAGSLADLILRSMR